MRTGAGPVADEEESDESRSASEHDMNPVTDLARVLRRSAELKEDLVAFGEGRQDGWS